MMVMKVAALLWLPVVCLGEVPRRASLLQLGSLSKRGATLASVGEARGFSSTLAGFQKYTDQLVDTYMRDGVAPSDEMKNTIALIVNYINIDMFNALVMLHHADLEVISECAPCDGDELLLGRSPDTEHSHVCARQRMCGMAAWGTDDTSGYNAYQDLQYTIPASSGEGREQEVWRLRDETAVLRKKHKDCVIENTQHDQKNDLSCRQYNKYRGALAPETDDPRNTVEIDVSVAEAVTVTTDYQDGSPRNIYEEVVLDGENKDLTSDDDAEDFLKTKYLQVSMCASRTHTTNDLLEGTAGGVFAVDNHVHVKMFESGVRPDDGHRLGKVTSVTGDQCEVMFPQGVTLTSDYSTRPADQFTDLHGTNTWTGPCNSLVKAPTAAQRLTLPTRGLVESPHAEHDKSIFWTQCCQQNWDVTVDCNTLGETDENCGLATICPHQRSAFGLSYNPPLHSHHTDIEGFCGTNVLSNRCDVEWSANCNHVDNLGDSGASQRYMSLYPECATSSGSAWKKIVQAVSSDCSAFRVDGRKYTNWDEGDLSKQMVMAEDAEARKVMEVCLEAVNHWFHPLYHYYVQCTHNDFHTYHEACKPDQNKYEEQACQWRTTEDQYCDDYKECIETEARACTEGEFCNSLDVKVKARKADYETGQRIICLLAVLVSDDTTEAGREGDVTDADGFHYTDADGNRVKRDEAVIYSSKKERLQECKDKENNDDGPENPHSRANENQACIPRKNSAFEEGNYKLVTGSETVTSASGHDGNSVTVQHLDDYTETNTDGQADGVKVATGSTLDADLDAQNNAINGVGGVRSVTKEYEAQVAWQDVGSTTETLKIAEWMSQGACKIDTEQWELEACGAAPGFNVELRYPETLCVPQCESRSDGDTPTCSQVPNGQFISISYSSTLTYGSTTPQRVATVPTFFVGAHNTETDHFSVPCSADFFLDQQWGYINAASCPVGDIGAETCAGATFEPAKSLNAHGHEFLNTDDKAGGLMLHMKMFPRPAIMRSPGRSDPLSETSVLCESSGAVSYDGGAGCKVILVHEDYFKGSVWQARAENTFYYKDSEMSTADNADDLYSDGPRGTSSAMPYAEFHGVQTPTDFKTYADAFDIYAQSAAKETYTAYPDHFSYEWCVKCSPDQLKMKEESAGWVWRSPQPTEAERLLMDGVTVRKMVWRVDDPAAIDALRQCNNPVYSPTPVHTPCWNWQDVTRTESTAFGADFGGNCEGATYQDPHATYTPAGETVQGFGDADTSFDRKVPAYHPKACTDSVAA